MTTEGCTCSLCASGAMDYLRRYRAGEFSLPSLRKQLGRTCEHCGHHDTLPGHRFCAECEKELGHG